METTTNQKRENWFWSIFLSLMSIGIASLATELISTKTFRTSISLAISGVIAAYIIWELLKAKSRRTKMIFASLMLLIIMGEVYYILN